jgi:hypothetical protein
MRIFSILAASTNVDLSPLPHAPATSHSVQAALSIVFAVLGAVALLVITISGVRYTLAQGDPQRVSQAKNGIIYALVGLVICITAEGIIAFVINRI